MRRIVEIGIGSLARTCRMIEAATGGRGIESVRYTAIDLFETRGAPALSLKSAYRQLIETRARVQLLPGDPYSVLALMANELVHTDLLVIAANADAESLARAWFYVPRLLHSRSLVLAEEPTAPDTAPELRRLDADEIESLARWTRARAA